MNERELIFAPAMRGPWGVTTKLGGPLVEYEMLDRATATAVRRAEAMLREGMVVLSRDPGDAGVAWAEHCFSLALLVVLAAVGRFHPLTVYAYDRIGYVCQLQDKPEEAERAYLRSREGRPDPPTIWNEATFLNLAILYGEQGRYDEQGDVLRDLEHIREVTSGQAPRLTRRPQEWT